MDEDERSDCRWFLHDIMNAMIISYGSTHVLEHALKYARLHPEFCKTFGIEPLVAKDPKDTNVVKNR
jgi:hypothetical protein